jgi:hypothetical protein
MSDRLILLASSLALAACAGMSLREVRHERPSNAQKFAELRFTSASQGSVKVFEIGGLGFSDYAYHQSPVWLSPGKVAVKYGCFSGGPQPSKTVVVRVPTSGVFALSCGPAGELLLARVQT